MSDSRRRSSTYLTESFDSLRPSFSSPSLFLFRSVCLYDLNDLDPESSWRKDLMEEGGLGVTEVSR